MTPMYLYDTSGAIDGTEVVIGTPLHVDGTHKLAPTLLLTIMYADLAGLISNPAHTPKVTNLVKATSMLVVLSLMSVTSLQYATTGTQVPFLKVWP